MRTLIVLAVLATAAFVTPRDAMSLEWCISAPCILACPEVQFLCNGNCVDQPIAFCPCPTVNQICVPR